ncbi:MAG: Fe2+-dependent dioxygenase [Pseudomonadota bacterium]
MTLLQVADILNSQNLQEVQEDLKNLSWRDGRMTAGRMAREVKRNEQADLRTPAGAALHSKLHDAVIGHVVLQAAARPRRMSRIMVSRTSEGGHYGAHVDNAIMGQDAERLRTDLSFTLFLTPPENYEGGELIIHSSSGMQSLKLEAGDLILYPSSDIHEVTPVTKGARVAAVGWIESMVADQSQRAMLFDLENLRVSLRASLPGNSAELLTLDKTIANLLRMWATP